MAAPVGGEVVLCVGISHSKSVVTVQRAFRAKYAKDPPTDKTVRAWDKQFTETGCLCKRKLCGRPFTAEYDVELVRPSFLHSPKKSTNISSCQKKTFSGFLVAVNNSIKVGPLVIFFFVINVRNHGQHYETYLY